MEQNNKTSNRNKIIGIAFAIVAFALAFIAVQQFFFKRNSIEKALNEAAIGVNKNCPMMVDQDTRLDHVAALPEKVFQYNYTLVNYSTSQVNGDSLRKYMEPGIIKTIKTNPQLNHFRKNKVTMVYTYNDKDGKFLMKITVTPNM